MRINPVNMVTGALCAMACLVVGWFLWMIGEDFGWLAPTIIAVTLGCGAAIGGLRRGEQ